MKSYEFVMFTPRVPAGESTKPFYQGQVPHPRERGGLGQGKVNMLEKCWKT